MIAAAFETNSLIDDLINVEYDREREILLLEGSAVESRRNDSPNDDAAQRQKIVSRHLAALAEHQQYLAALHQCE